MRKHLSSIIIVLLVALGIVYRQPIFKWLKDHQSKGLAAFNIPTNLFSDASFFPGPLRSNENATASQLTKLGVIFQTNVQRKDYHLKPLTENKKLDEAAQLKLKDMFDKQYFEHVSPDGKGPRDLANQVGYAYIVDGENLALGNFKDDKTLVEAWMNSPGHRANILSEKYQEIGVAVGKGMFEGHMTWLAVQEFGMPASACPGVDTNLKHQIDANQSMINSMAAQLEKMKTDLESNQNYNRTEYNQAVSIYNALVQKFNALIEQTKNMVSQYNSQVNNLNSCIES